MKSKKSSYILLAIGVVLIVLGALLPTIFKVEKDKFSFYREMSASEYTCRITITSNKDYNVNSAVVYLEDFFGDEEITKQILSSNITKSTSGDDNVYTFTILFDSFGEYSKFSEVKKVVLNTNIGTRTAYESAFKWTTPVMIVMIVFGTVLIIAGITIISANKSNKKFVSNIRKELQEKHPEIDTYNMTDKEIQEKWYELDNSEDGGLLASLKQVLKEPTSVICEYCGTENAISNSKCTSCGGKLTKKK